MGHEINHEAQAPTDDNRRHEFGREPISPARPRQSGFPSIRRTLSRRLRGPCTRNSGRELSRIGIFATKFVGTFGVMRIFHRASPVRPLNKDVQDTLEVAGTILIA
jgi:hypothetical protein